MKRTIERLRSEFLEMPGLRLTLVQVQRFCGVDPTICKAVLDALLDTKFLAMTPDGHYVRRTDDPGVRSTTHQTPARRARLPRAS